MKIRPSRRSRRGNISELPVSLMVFLLFIVFPAVNLMFLAVAAGTVALITTQAAGSAAMQGTYSVALSAMQSTVQLLSKSGFSNLVRITPQGGYRGSGADLYVVETPISGGVSNYYGPNSVTGLNPDPSKYIYEYQVRTCYNVPPMLNLASVPFIGTVPLIGSPAKLSWNVERSVEMAYSQNVTANNGGGQLFTGSLPAGPSQGAPSTIPVTSPIVATAPDSAIPLGSGLTPYSSPGSPPYNWGDSGGPPSVYIPWMPPAPSH